VPDLAAIAKRQQEALVAPIAGAAGGIAALVCAGAAFYLVRQRRARQEARMRMKVSSRRFMGSQASAYGNTHQDGAVNIGAARGRAERPAEVKVAFRPEATQSNGGGSGAAGGRKAARSNSMRK